MTPSSSTDQPGLVTAEFVKGVSVIRLNRPEVRNALTSELVEALSHALTLASEDAGIRGVVLTGAGRAFCSGEDLKVASTASGPEFRAFIGHLQALTRQLLDIDKPVVAALNGPAVGGGAELAMACDVRIASTTASFQMPEVDLGIVVTGGTLFLLSQLVGRGRAVELLLSGRTVSADEAQQIGLVSSCVGESDVLAEAIGRAQEFGNVPDLAMRELKRGLRALDRDALELSMEIESAAAERLFADPTSRENAHKFVNRGNVPPVD